MDNSILFTVFGLQYMYFIETIRHSLGIIMQNFHWKACAHVLAMKYANMTPGSMQLMETVQCEKLYTSYTKCFC